MASAPISTTTSSERVLNSIDQAFGVLLNEDKNMQRLVESPDDFAGYFGDPLWKRPSKMGFSIHNGLADANDVDNINGNPAISDISASDSVSLIQEEIGDSKWEDLQQIIEELEMPAENGGQSATNTVQKIANIITGKYFEYLETEWKRRRKIWQKLVGRSPNKEYENSPYVHATFGEYISKHKIQLQVPFDFPQIGAKRNRKNPVARDEVANESAIPQPVQQEKKILLPKGVASESQKRSPLKSAIPKKEGLFKNTTAAPNPENRKSWGDILESLRKSKVNNSNNQNSHIPVMKRERGQRRTTEISVEKLSVEMKRQVEHSATSISSAEKYPRGSKAEPQQGTVASPLAENSSHGTVRVVQQQSPSSAANPSSDESHGEQEIEDLSEKTESNEDINQLTTLKMPPNTTVVLQKIASSVLKPAGEATNEDLELPRPKKSASYIIDNWNPTPLQPDESEVLEEVVLSPPSFVEEVDSVYDAAMHWEATATKSATEKISSDNGERAREKASAPPPETVASEVKDNPQEGTSAPDDEGDISEYVEYLDNEWRTRRNIWLRGVNLILNKGLYESSPYSYATFDEYIRNHPNKLNEPHELPDIEPVLLAAISKATNNNPSSAADKANKNAELNGVPSSSKKLPRSDAPDPITQEEEERDSMLEKKDSWWDVMFPEKNNN